MPSYGENERTTHCPLKNRKAVVSDCAECLKPCRHVTDLDGDLARDERFERGCAPERPGSYLGQPGGETYKRR